MNKWIRVEFNSLPIDQSNCLIVFINSVGRHVGEALFKGNTFYYIAETDSGYYESPYGIVTHWMYLPELPEN